VTETPPARPPGLAQGSRRVLVSEAAANAAQAMPAEQRRAVAAALRKISDGPVKGRPTKIPVPGGEGTVWALRAGDRKDAPMLLYRSLSEAEDPADGILVLAAIGPREWNGYLRAERSGELDTAEGRDILLAQVFDSSPSGWM
jgi:hypothetical protein